MGCNPNRLNCSPDDIFAANANFNCSKLVTPSSLQAEQVIYDKMYEDLINSFGVKVNYYINTFNLSAADLLYGEHPTSIFYGPVEMMMYVEINNESISLQSFGFDAADEFTGYVSIRSFEETISGGEFLIQQSDGSVLQYETYAEALQTQSQENILTELLSILVTENSSLSNDLIGDDYTALNKYLSNGQSIEPKSGDLLEVTSLGCDRPNGRGTKIFEVTERVDQDISTINPLLGHYVYRLRAKRYEYSFEPGAPKELANQQIFENSFSGVISSNISNDYITDVPSDIKSYPGDIDNESQNIFNMDVNNNDIYGDYY